MTDQPETLAPYRLPWRRDQLKQVGALAPVFRYFPRHPGVLIGAAVVGVAGMLAWRNRDKIRDKAAPMLAEARLKGRALADETKIRGRAALETAKAKGETAVKSAKAKGETVAAKTGARKSKPKTAAAKSSTSKSSTAKPSTTSMAGAPGGPPELH